MADITSLSKDVVAVIVNNAGHHSYLNSHG
jgi:hypothetical protein